jgi:Subtilase family
MTMAAVVAGAEAGATMMMTTAAAGAAEALPGMMTMMIVSVAQAARAATGLRHGCGGSTCSGARETGRAAEVSGLGLTEADLESLDAVGFRVIRSRPLVRLATGFAARLRPPGGMSEREALQLARRTVPQAVFDLSHLYGESQGAGAYAPELVRFAPQKSCATGLRIGLIDGAVADHPMLADARIIRRSFSQDDGSALHGTAVASVMVGADPTGRALLSQARLYAAAVFSGGRDNAAADVIDLVAAIDWLASERVATVNMSIAGPENALLQAAVSRAAQGGMIIVAAAGNGGARGAPRYPAAYPEVISVSAVDARRRAYRHNTRGPYIDVAAPGVDIWAADARGGSGALWSGTSFAAPFVTVELAAARQAGLVGSVSDARAYLAQRARDIGAPGADTSFGLGLMQSGACR